MGKVLIITYYWPPAGGGGVQRWLKFARYLPEHGWEPVVYTPSNADYPLLDPTLAQEIPDAVQVIKQPIREPRRVYRRLLGKQQGGEGKAATLDQMFYTDPKRRSWKQSLGIWIRGNLFIPDARVWWVRPSVRFLQKFLKEESITTIITTGPPHSMHLIGLGLKHKHRTLRWLADFRDPWTAIEYYDKMPLTRRADRVHRRLEQQVLQYADAVTTVSPAWANMLGASRGREVGVLTNGYDPADFTSPAPPLDEQVTICHVGTLALDRNPRQLWRLLSALAPQFGFEVVVKLLGSTDPAVLDSIEAAGLAYEDLGYLDHEAAIRAMRSAHFLLLLVNKAVAENVRGRIPGKLFEYLAARRPVICVSQVQTDATAILARHGHLVVDPDDPAAGKALRSFIGDPPKVTDQPPEEYSRPYLARQLASTLSRLSEQHPNH
ncbi:MAG: hypothetical protein R3301_14630 [Saprospiraceae bacterium]|nr:hypothetical protein [Saprospiraceae bacterium]